MNQKTNPTWFELEFPVSPGSGSHLGLGPGHPGPRVPTGRVRLPPGPGPTAFGPKNKVGPAFIINIYIYIYICISYIHRCLYSDMNIYI